MPILPPVKKYCRHCYNVTSISRGMDPTKELTFWMIIVLLGLCVFLALAVR